MRATYTVTDSWVNVFTGPGLVTVDHIGEGILMLNNAALDTAALYINREDRARIQIDQRASVDTYIKATGAGWIVTYDTDV